MYCTHLLWLAEFLSDRLGDILYMVVIYTQNNTRTNFDFSMFVIVHFSARLTLQFFFRFGIIELFYFFAGLTYMFSSDVIGVTNILFMLAGSAIFHSDWFEITGKIYMFVI